MPYKLSGVLKSPNGQPLTGVDIQFIAQQTQTPVLQQTDHNIRLGLDGAYNVTLENNTYAVKAQINGLGPQHMGYILISSDTPSGLDLPQLLRSYSQQSTAPDYAQLIEKWLTEAKSAADTSTAQAASAKSQADRAKSEADRASQISGLDTVADAIGLAAVPFPDVWIPFNDSLRMFAGYGREVKVGDDVVARMINFERSTTATYIDKSGVLRTAAINEPRFEKQGLLIEGQSTNLVVRSEGTTFQTANASFQTLTNYVSGVLPVVGQRILFAANNNETNAGLIQASMTLDGGSSYTYSLFIKVEDGDDSDLANCLGAYSASSASITNRTVIQDFGNGVKRLSGNISVGGTGSQTVYIRVQRRGAWATTTWTAVVGGVQVESLPFASSYIPTNGAAVTRAADLPFINTSRNLHFPLTLICEYSLLSKERQAIPSAYIAGFTYNSKTYDGLRISCENPSALMLRTLKEGVGVSAGVSCGTSGIAAMVATNDGRREFYNGSSSALSSGGWGVNGFGSRIVIGASDSGENGRYLFGHIRNLRIWHRALSDVQIKGLK